MLQLSDSQQKVLDAVASKGRMTAPQLVNKLKFRGVQCGIISTLWRGGD
jgi:hypothetical protein